MLLLLWFAAAAANVDVDYVVAAAVFVAVIRYFVVVSGVVAAVIRERPRVSPVAAGKAPPSSGVDQALLPPG